MMTMTDRCILEHHISDVIVQQKTANTLTLNLGRLVSGRPTWLLWVVYVCLVLCINALCLVCADVLGLLSS